MDEFQKHVIIVAGGKGNRIGGEVPKQMRLINNCPVIIHTLNRFINYDSSINIIVVLPELLMESFNHTLTQYDFNHNVTLVKGGETRFHSVKNGLEHIHNEGVVGIHDAARPLVSIETIRRTFTSSHLNGNAIPVITMTESIRFDGKGANHAVNRDDYKIIQTPQCFHVSLIKRAFQQGYRPEFTDDASVLEGLGEKINLVAGNPENIKITFPVDLKIAEAIMNQSSES